MVQRDVLETITPRRAALVVPASSERMLAKARSLAVDELVLDLEDGVAPADKHRARELAGAWLSAAEDRAAGTVAVRVNGADTPDFAQDLEALRAWPAAADSVVLPKAESVAALDRLPEDVPVQLLIESARGLLAAQELCGLPSVCAVILGYADLCASLGRPTTEIADPTAWASAQDHLVTCARAAGIQAIDGPVLALDDASLPARAAAWGRRRGFDGKWVIHPGHVKAVTAAFTPSPDEVAAAAALLDSLAAAEAAGSGAARHDGMMIDEALRRSAQQTLARAGRTRDA
jgi:citrate lyase subunit beta/citryl-CoA lyase